MKVNMTRCKKHLAIFVIWTATAALIAIFVFAGFYNCTKYEYALSAEDERFLLFVSENQQDYLLSLQRGTGAYTKWSGADGDNEIVPYFACFAALALLENEKNIPSVKKYIDWHFAHLNADDYNGMQYTVYDYSVIGGEEIKKEQYDSTDSYAALFLMLLKKYYEITGERTIFDEKRSEIFGVAEVILSTMHNGLTYAKPDCRIKYTMNNCEAASGLNAAAYLAEEVFNSNSQAQRYLNGYNQIKQAITQQLYNNTYGNFAPHLGATADLSVFYPDAACQLYPALFGIIEPLGQGMAHYNNFNKRFADWTAQSPDGFPWALLCYAAAIHGDAVRSIQYLHTVNGKYFGTALYPWYSMEGAMCVLAANHILKDSKAAAAG